MSSQPRARQRRLAPASRTAGRQQPRPRPATCVPAAWPRLITERYAPPAPRDLPELRGHLAAWLDSEAPEFYLTMALVGRQWVPPAATLAADAAQVAGQERLRTHWSTCGFTGVHAGGVAASPAGRCTADSPGTPM